MINPKVENGTLKFNSEDDAFNYLIFLADELQKESNNILESQAALGFTSRLKIVTDLGEENGNGSIFRVPHLNAMLNTNYEIIIGDKIYTHKNHEESWIANVSDVVSLSVFRSKNPGTYIDDSEINSDMIIDGKREVNSEKCCTRFGIWPSSNTFSTNTHTHLGNSFTLMAQAEVVKGKWWGIFVWGTCSGLKNGNAHLLALEVDNVYGHFRDKNCVVRFSEWDNDFCSSCKKISANIFHRFGTRDRFNEFGVGAKCKLFYAPNMFVSVDVYPQCN